MDNIEYLMKHGAGHIYIKRDDRIPFSFGGNKVRIAAELMKDIEAGGYTAVISYGSPSSNMNRAVADMAKSIGLRCVVIVKTENTADSAADCRITAAAGWNAADSANSGNMAVGMIENREAMQFSGDSKEILQTENERLVRESGAELVFCHGGGSDVKACVETVMERLKAEGEKPYYIYGDSTGSGNETALMRASYLEYAEILDYEHRSGVHFDAIVLTAGTGMTIAGLAAAMMMAEKGNGSYDEAVLNYNTCSDSTCRDLNSEIPKAVRDGKTVLNGTRLIGMSAARDEQASRRKIREALEAFFAANQGRNKAETSQRQPVSTIEQTVSDDSISNNDIPQAETQTDSNSGILNSITVAELIPQYLPEICDSYLCGGYGRYNSEIEELIKHMDAEYGLPLDPTYTGKSFYGMLKEIEAGRIAGNILFIHTGGYPVYLDWKRSI